MIWNRKSGEPKFLHMVQYLEKEETDEWEGQMQGFMKKIATSGANDP